MSISKVQVRSYIITDIPIQSPIWIKADVMIIDVSGASNDYALVCAGYRNTSGNVAVRIGMGWYKYRPQYYYRMYYFSDAVFSANGRYSNVFYGEEGLQRQWLNGVELTPTNYATEPAYLQLIVHGLPFTSLPKVERIMELRMPCS